MVNYSARTDEIITLNENIIIINNLKKNKKRTNIGSIHKQLIKSNNIQDLTREDLFQKLQNLVAEGQVVNRMKQNNDSFHVNKDVVGAFAENILAERPVRFHDRSFDSLTINHSVFQSLSN